MQDLISQIQRQFGHSGFRPGQEDLVRAVLSGRDALGVMPTGGGKSLCFQLPAALMPGTALVVSPLIALMKDQVDQLQARGIAAESYHSGMTTSERRRATDRLKSGKLKLLYMAPERMQADGFMEIVGRTKLSLIAIDEAHCISHWGHDFRPDYRRLGSLRDLLSSSGSSSRLPVVALTATATRQVQLDIIERLQMQEPTQVITGFRRTNLAFEVKMCSGRAEKIRHMRQLISEALAADGSAVIYAATRKNVEFVHKELRSQDVGFYHAGLGDEERTEVQNDFLSGKKRVLVATNAFGMGIDKANVRLVAHFDIPGSVEAYYQEAGRAGRDGKPARCTLLFNYADVATQDFFIRKTAEEASELNDERIRNQEALLKQLVRYSYATQCRQQLILGYFGDPEARDFKGCGLCDQCRPELKPRIAADEMMTRSSRQVLATVARLNGRFGKNRISDLLKGSQAETFLSTGLQNQSTYGLLSHWTLDSIKKLVDQLIECSYLQVTGLDYPVLQLTTSGVRAMKAEIPIQLPADVSDIQKESSSKKKSKTKTSHTSTSADLGLLQKLKAFRKEEAARRSVPPFVIFHDKTLENIAADRPKRASDMSNIAGMGPKKVELYGDQLIKIIQSTPD